MGIDRFVYTNDDLYIKPEKRQKVYVCMNCSKCRTRPIKVDNVTSKIYLSPDVKIVNDLEYICPEIGENVCLSGGKISVKSICHDGNDEVRDRNCLHCAHNIESIVVKCDPAQLGYTNEDCHGIRITRTLIKCETYGHKAKGTYERTNYVCNRFTPKGKK